jgi:multidrug transporter EmrE-like cation transporter
MDMEKPVHSILILIILFIVSSEACAQYYLKKCKLEQQLHFFILAVFFYVLVCLGLYRVYNYRAVGIVNLLWSCLSIITMLGIGAIFFDEAINIFDLVGVFFVFVGFGFIFLYGH